MIQSLIKQKYLKVVSKLDDIQLGKLMRALFMYADDGTLPQLSDKIVEMSFDFLKADIDEAKSKHIARCKVNRQNAQKRWNKSKMHIPKNKNIQASSPSSNTPSKISPSISASDVVSYWNNRVVETNSKMPLVSHIDKQRRNMIDSILRQYGNAKCLQKAFENAFTSSFLNGKNSNHWVANIDWILSPKNFVRVFDGNFNPKTIPTLSSKEEYDHGSQTISPEQILADRKLRKQKHNERVQRQDDCLKTRLLSAIKAYEENHKSSFGKVALNAYKDGLMKRLGIDWSPQKS